MDEASDSTGTDGFVVVLVTAPNEKVAAQLARALVEEKLAACVNILPGVRSIYAWQGKTCDEPEVLCTVKTRASLLAAVRNRVITLHPYEVPEVIALPIVGGSTSYLHWLRSETRDP